MNKTKIKYDVDRLYSRLSEKFDMKRNEVVELSFKTCSDINGNIFVGIECVVVDKTTRNSKLVTWDLDDGKNRHKCPDWMERIKR